ncbi:DUF3160 domain-containing protein [Candidatus Obscuribacterales bacterium]|nr:DUF3160 domain-containing protein [Candidatus Obscuribacterales bacterium]
MKHLFVRFCALFTAAMMWANASPGPVFAQLSDGAMPSSMPNLQPFRLMNPGTNRPLKTREKQTLEDIFRRTDLKTMNGPPVDLSATRIPGLSDRAVAQLGFNYFVIVNGTKYTRISDIYAENRAENKANFVTVDSIVHPYFAFTNGMLASAIEEGVYKDLYGLLKAMLVSSIADYRRTDDDEVKDDIQRNLAYLCVALVLLEPKTVLPEIGGAIDLVKADLALIESGKAGRSQIFSTYVDFGTFRPWGFMAQRPKLKRFHIAYQWLSRMPFPLSNSGDTSAEGGGNLFRRAVLLYRSIVLANVGGNEPALARWNRIAMATALLNFDSNAKKKTIIAPELQGVFKTSETDLARLLHSLSQPFLRTKLLLSVRNQRPMELNARSVFEMDQDGGTAGDDVVFRMFPLIDPPELVWLREEGHNYLETVEGPVKVPIGLIDLHAHGAQAATNILSEQLDTLDQGLTKRVPRLERLTKLINQNDAGMDRHWTIASSIFRTYPDTVQIGLRSDLWMVKSLETALAAWIDSYSACLVIEPGQGGDSAGKNAGPVGSAGKTAPPSALKSTETPASQAGSKAGLAGAGGDFSRSSTPARPTPPQFTQHPSLRVQQPAPSRPARFHYLEPRVDLYKDLQVDCTNLIKQLTELGYMPVRYKPRSEDFMRLLRRLTIISEAEVKNEPITMPDFNLLANIDRVLAPVDCPLSSYIFLDSLPDTAGSKSAASASEKTSETTTINGKEISTAPRTGATMGVGRAGRLYIVCSTSQGSMLTRGGTYTYYEIQGGPQRDEHWERKLTYNLLQSPSWTRKYNFAIEESHSRNVKVTGEQSGSASPASK